MEGELIGSQPDMYPFDFGIYARYEKDIRKITAEKMVVKIFWLWNSYTSYR
jgi:hypothetical protein